MNGLKSNFVDCDQVRTYEYDSDRDSDSTGPVIEKENGFAYVSRSG